MNHDHYPDSYILDILRSVKTIALVGASDNPARPSFLVLRYLIDRGYRLFPVNPGQTGTTMAGQPVYGRLADIPEPIDMVEIFRNSEAAGAVVDEALALSPLPKVIWMQLTVRNDAAAAKAEAAGLQVVMNRCPKIEYGRLSTEIGWIGVNSGVITAKRPILHGTGAQKLSIGRKT